MKKNLYLAFAAALAAAAGQAAAADVAFYGRADLGLRFENCVSKFGSIQTNRAHNLTLASGSRTGSRVGLKGTEALGNGLTVGFVLENGFDADTGALHTDGKLFDREATLSVSGAFGTVYAGRMGSLISDAGSVGFYAGAVSPFGSGIGRIAGHQAVMTTAPARLDNAVAYVTPEVNGFTGYLQYGMGSVDENTSKTNRYAAIGGKYERGPLTVAVLADYLNRQSAGTVTVDGLTLPVTTLTDNFLNTTNITDTFTFNLGGSYDFGPAKVTAVGQVFHNAGMPGNSPADLMTMVPPNHKQLVNIAADAAGAPFDGFGLNIGVSAPVAGGTAMLSAGYMDAVMKVAALHDTVRSWSVLAGYDYSLSPRTSVYAATGMTRHKFEDKGEGAGFGATASFGMVTAGLVHKF